MIRVIQKLKNRKGFTLVELIVVLVILAILAALLVPALTGYIDKAKKTQVIAETRMVVMAAQTVFDEQYANGTFCGAIYGYGEYIKSQKPTKIAEEIHELSETSGSFKVTLEHDATSFNLVSYKIVEVEYKSTSGTVCTYTWDSTNGGSYSVS